MHTCCSCVIKGKLLIKLHVVGKFLRGSFQQFMTIKLNVNQTTTLEKEKSAKCDKEIYLIKLF